MQINPSLTPSDLRPLLSRFWDVSAQKLQLMRQHWSPGQGAPVYTEAGRYTARGWTEWTQGFQFGSEIIQYDATGDHEALDAGRAATLQHMAPHLAHFGVHDHGFNNVSTYGHLLRLQRAGRITVDPGEAQLYALALQLSGSVQAKRWTSLPEGGYLYSFNGPHSLFVDTLRTLRSLLVAHELGFYLWQDHDERVNLQQRAIEHALTTARHAVFYGTGRDSYDEWGRTAHESLFNLNDGHYRCPNSQQGFSGFTTWTRGLSWAMLGFPELLEYLSPLPEAAFAGVGEKQAILGELLQAAQATCDFYLAYTALDGIPYWDTGAPHLHRLGAYQERRSEPGNDHEPVDSSAAAIGAQGLLRLGHILQQQGDAEAGNRYWQAGLTTLQTLLEEPYLSLDPDHQGLLLHSIYHRPNGWDYVPAGSQIPWGEACMWGDYHLREAALYVQRVADGGPYHCFFETFPIPSTLT
jgi:hypothetical protein